MACAESVAQPDMRPAKRFLLLRDRRFAETWLPDEGKSHRLPDERKKWAADTCKLVGAELVEAYGLC